MNYKIFIAVISLSTLLSCQETKKEDTATTTDTTTTPVEPKVGTYTQTTKIPQSITTPDMVETAIGNLEFFDGVPSEQTVQTLYDNLDRMRGVQTFLTGYPAVSAYALYNGPKAIGADRPNKIQIWKQMMDSKTLLLTGNTSTLYAVTTLDLKTDGATVIELPPGMLGMLNSAWFKFVGNFGAAGQDKGKGGKYLIVPPGYTGTVPDGYFVLKPPPTAIGCFSAAPSPRVWNRRLRISKITSRSTHWPRPVIRPRPNLSTHPARWQISLPPMISTS